MNESENMEIWSNIPKLKNYQISTFGRLKSKNLIYKDSIGRNIHRKGVIRKCHPNNCGYLRIPIKVNNKYINYSIHKLVAETFIPNPENKPCVNHIDGNKLNNYIENLEWVTYSQNRLHALENNLSSVVKGEEHVKSKLTEKEAFDILNDNSRSKKELCETYNVTRQTIESIKQGKRWKHLLVADKLKKELE